MIGDKYKIISEFRLSGGNLEPGTIFTLLKDDNGLVIKLECGTIRNNIRSDSLKRCINLTERRQIVIKKFYESRR